MLPGYMPSVKRICRYKDMSIDNMKPENDARSVSDWIREVIDERILEYIEDIKAFEERRDEPVIGYEELLRLLKPGDLRK